MVGIRIEIFAPVFDRFREVFSSWGPEETEAGFFGLGFCLEARSAVRFVLGKKGKKKTFVV